MRMGGGGHDAGPEAQAYPHYRPDIDGLRAFAISSVILFHAFPKMLPGGFIGVDIFFVISGFLISSILFRGFLYSGFSFSGFYVGRLLRLMPALLIVLFTAFIVGWFVLMPEELGPVGKHIAGGIGFSDNILYWLETNYFDQDSATKPLLHLWSLGIEEQFYLFFPALIWVIWTWRRYMLAILGGLAALSFILNLAFVNLQPSADFFLPQFRVWELLVGSLLAVVHLQQLETSSADRKPSRNANGLIHFQSMLGLILIVVALGTVKSGDPFPGWRAVIPVGGTLLLIAAGPNAWVNRYLLARRWVVFVGLISYPLYLWHWPLLSFGRIIVGQVPTIFCRIALLVAAVVLASLTYHLIERPIRFGKRHWAKTVGLVCMALILAYVGANAYHREGLPFRTGWAFRFPPLLRSLVTYKFDDDRYFRSGVCHLRVNSGPEGFAGHCAANDGGEKPSLFLWGDSHAAHLYSGLIQEFPDVRLEQYTAPGCQPILDWDVPGFPRCREVNDFILKKIGELKPDTVLLTSRWLGVGEGDKILATISRIKALGVSSIVILGPVTRWEPNLVSALLQRYREKPFAEIPFRMMDGVDREKFVIDKELHRLADVADVRYISALDYLCNQDGCLVRPLGGDVLPGAVMAIDDSHFTPEGSRYFMSLLRRSGALPLGSKAELH